MNNSQLTNTDFDSFFVEEKPSILGRVGHFFGNKYAQFKEGIYDAEREQRMAQEDAITA